MKRPTNLRKIKGWPQRIPTELEVDKTSGFRGLSSTHKDFKIQKDN